MLKLRRTKMPLKELKYTCDFIKPSLLSFILLLVLIYIFDFLNTKIIFHTEKKALMHMMMIVLLTIFINGYGLCITKDVLNNRNRLPKLGFYKSLVLGIKGGIVTFIYSAIQVAILFFVSNTFNFPIIEFGEGELLIENFGSLFIDHSSLEIILFGVFVVAVFYIFTFFMEIALARLADKGKLTSALRVKEIKKCIDIIGWGNYASDYTKLILAIAILAYIKYGIDFIFLENGIFDMIIGGLIFIIQFIGIGMIYRTYKLKSLNLERPRRKENY